MFLILISSLIAFSVTLLSVPVLIRKFRNAKIVGRDVHKPGKPEVPEMGGLAIVAGLVAGILVAIALTTLERSTFAPIYGVTVLEDITGILAALVTILIVSIIGIFDDLVRMRQRVKAILPLFASMPLIAVAAGQSYITLPGIGQLYVPVIYPLILIPLAVAVVSNLTNMLAGFNGLEAGMGIIGCLSLGLIAIEKGSIEAAVLLLSMTAALSAFVWFNKYPAKVFMGDVGTLSIGACIVSSVIIGNFEMAGVVVMMPYLFDFIIKIKNRFPREIDYTQFQNGKLYSSRVVGLPSLIMRLSGGITETRLVAYVICLELACGSAALLAF